MSSVTFLLATHDPELLRAWRAVVPAGGRVITLNEAGLLGGAALQKLVLVAVVDKAAGAELPATLANVPTVWVGNGKADPASRGVGDFSRSRVFLSREDSRVKLGEFLPLLEEIAERTATANLLSEKKAAALAVPAFGENRTNSEQSDAWDFFTSAVDALGSREQLLAEFNRTARRTLGTSHVIFFLKEGSEFRADRGRLSCAVHDPLIQYLHAQPVVLDGLIWPGNPNPVVELTMRQRMAAWSVRLIAPMHDNGRLVGLIGFGVRDDGLPYDGANRAQAVKLARLLRQMLVWLPEGAHTAAPDRWELGQKYLPGILLLASDEEAPAQTPPAVVALIAEVRQLRTTRKLTPELGQPFRATAGIVAETQGVWVSWEDASVEMHDSVRRARSERLELLHDLALTLNHELGNSLVSLAALRHNPGAETNSPVLLAAIKRDIASLEAINRHLASIPTFSEVSAESVDLRALVFAVGRKVGVVVETSADPVTLDIAPRLIEFGLEAIIESIVENRPGLGKRDLAISVRASGAGDGLAAVLTIRGPGLSLEGILPAPEPGATPTHGRIGVFIAKEIIRLHGGSIVGGAGVNGPAISVSIRMW